MKKTLIIFLLAILVSAMAASIVYLKFRSFAETPLSPGSTNEIVFVVKPGTLPSHVATDLAGKGLVKSRTWMKLLMRFNGRGKAIKSGEYSLSPSMSPEEILRKLVKGGVVTYKVTIPEGYRAKEIASLLEKSGLARADRFLAVVLDKKSAAKFGIQGAPNLEGYLFPDTYRFAKGLAVSSIVSAMVDRFKKEWTRDYDKRAKELGMTMNQVVTLASIIEKETGDPRERPMISAVFHSRLKKGWKLQSDPTVIYGIRNYNGNITRKDLLTDHPYNTYTRQGLPPGPIASPGGDAIRAALYPAKVPYMFFVSRNNGTHVFSVTLQEHNKAVEKWQRRYFNAKEKERH
ncbi:MAG: endolytic transglycosylase MltG [Deltaproteobacteria bacterium]|nr:endolytic transglycosylase MltG [Deltaproteobacteria bacterium]